MAADPEAEKTALASVEAWKAAARRGRGRRGARRARRGRQDRHQPDGRRPWPRPAPARRRGSGPATLREVFGEFRAPDRGLRRGRRRRRPAPSWPPCASGCKATGEELGGRLRLLVGKPGLDGHSQRRRAGRRPRPRRRLRGHLPGHPADARSRSSPPRSPRTCTASASRSCPARTWSWCPPCSTGCARPGWATSRSSSAGSSPTPTRRRLRRARRRRRLHAQGLRPHRDHGRHRRRDPEGQRPRLSRADGRHTAA